MALTSSSQTLLSDFVRLDLGVVILVLETTLILRDAPDGARISSDWGIAWAEARERAAESPVPRSVTMHQLQRLAVETAAHAEANPTTVSEADLTEYLEMREQLTQDLREYGGEEGEIAREAPNPGWGGCVVA